SSCKPADDSNRQQLQCDGMAATEENLPAHIVLLQQAWAFQEAGDLGRADAVYLEVLRALPEEPHALNQLGYLRLRQGRLPEAIELMRRSIEVMPDQWQFYLNLGIAL